MLVLIGALATGCGKAPAEVETQDLAAAPSDMTVAHDLELLRCLVIDDMDVTHGCTSGGTGIGDHDDGGGQATIPPPDLGPDAKNLAFGALCDHNTQCTSGVCFDFRVRGQFCTALCSVDADCPAPPAAYGCNGQGVCKIQPTN